MTNEEAREILSKINIAVGLGESFNLSENQILEATSMAIEALGTQSCDCVSRKDVIILIDEATELHPYKVIGDSETYSNYNQGWEDACNWLYANIESDNLKTVTPQQKVTGSWVEKQVVDNEEVEIEQWQSARCSKCVDKIKAEIEQLRLHKAQFLTGDNKICIDSQEVLNIIDKYKAESEDEE